MKSCVECSTLFEPASNRQKYCSSLCRNGGYATCEGCGAVFVRSDSSRRQQRFCSSRCYASTAGRTANRTCGVCSAETFPGNKFCSRACAVEASRSERVRRVCPQCGTEFASKLSLRRKYCSRSCNAVANNSAKARFALGDATLHTSGYMIVKTVDGWKMQHRLVMEELLGRPLETHERVHHRNGDRADNRPENLELWKLKNRKDPAGVRAVDYHCPGCRCGDPMT